jgi:hypothetical protein
MSDPSDPPSGGTPARGAPNPDRPRLPEEMERQLAVADRKSAEGYAAVEHAVELINQKLADGTVRVTIEFTDTVMHRLRGARQALEADVVTPPPETLPPPPEPKPKP